MGTVLGLIGIVFFIAIVIVLAAAVTWTVAKLTPSGARGKTQPPAA